MSSGVLLQVTKRGDVFNPKHVDTGRENVRRLMEGEIYDIILAELKRWTGRWKHAVTIKTDRRGTNQHQEQTRYIIVGEGSPDNKDPVAVFRWVSQGVRPHKITPELGGLLYFRAGIYFPSTEPAGPTGHGGVMLGGNDEFIMTGEVDHPGVVARNIEQKLVQAASKIVFRELAGAVLKPFRDGSAT